MVVDFGFRSVPANHYANAPPSSDLFSRIHGEDGCPHGYYLIKQKVPTCTKVQGVLWGLHNIYYFSESSAFQRISSSSKYFCEQKP